MKVRRGTVDTLGAMQPYVAPRKWTEAEGRAACLTCAREALTQPEPAADLRLLLEALGLPGSDDDIQR